MIETIQSIIKSLPSGTYFDSHYIISVIIKKHKDTYPKFCAEHLAEKNTTEVAHSQIAKEIKKLTEEDHGSLVEQITDGTQGKSMSYNIRGNATPCTLWKRA